MANRYLSAIAVAVTILLVSTASGPVGRRLLLRTGLGDPWYDPDDRHGSITLEPTPAPRGWEAFLIPVGRFPVAEKRRPPLEAFFKRLTQEITARWGVAAEVFVQSNQLNRAGSAAALWSHSRTWQPEPGLGVWPDRPAPTLWTWKDFLLPLIGRPPRTLVYYVFRITAGDEAREDARKTMAGRGVVLQIMSREPIGAYLEKTKAVLLPAIQEPTFRSFAWFVPLLDARSLGSSSAEQLDKWLCGAAVYVRESPQDAALLIVSRQRLVPILTKLGGSQPPAKPDHWQVPVAGL